jgi:membrane protease YdiL (CAAX protease family)
LELLLVFEGLLLCAGYALLIRKFRSLAPRLLGHAPSPLPASRFRGTELAIAAGLAVGCSVVMLELARAAASFWLPKPPPGTFGLAHVVASGGFQLGLLAGLGLAWLALLRPSARPADAAPTPPHPRVGPARILRGALFTFIAGLVVVGPLSYAWQAGLEALGVKAPPQPLLSLFSETGDKLSLALLVFFAVIAAPLTEELAFRVGLFRWLRGRLPRAAALLLPALVFALVHGNLSVFAPLTALAVILALGYEHYGHPAVPILAHALFNLNTIALLLAGFPA